jgi:hypothetical protein
MLSTVCMQGAAQRTQPQVVTMATCQLPKKLSLAHLISVMMTATTMRTPSLSRLRLVLPRSFRLLAASWEQHSFAFLSHLSFSSS